jgi:hypothetical protein
LSAGFLIVSAHLVERRWKRLTKENFLETYGTLVEELELKGNSWRKRFNTIFLFRRTVYSLILVALYDQPYLQLYLCIFIVVLPVRSITTHRCYST